jgi:hypothetical protein
MRDRARRRVLACESKIRVRCTQFESGKETLNGGCSTGVANEGEMMAERVDSEERKIERGGRFWPAKPKTVLRRSGVRKSKRRL